MRRYGRSDVVELAEITCVWFGVLHTQLVRVILVRDDKPRTKDKDERGYSLTVPWYTRHGHDPEQAARQRTRQRWYTTKAEPPFEDMAVKPRRMIITARSPHPGAYQPQPEETRADLPAWAATET